MQTGIGAPWEVWFQSGYTVLMKGGNLRGYSALFSIIPDLKLGMLLSLYLCSTIKQTLEMRLMYIDTYVMA